LVPPPEPETPRGPDPLDAVARKVVFQHTTLCQAYLPYRNPGDDVRLWTQRNGKTALMVEAGYVIPPNDGAPVPVGLPYGTKPRLLLAWLNAEAVKTQSPEIKVGKSLTAFVDRIGLFDNGETIRTVTEQLLRLSAARVTLGVTMKTDRAVRTRQVPVSIVDELELWFEKDGRGRLPWQETLRLGDRYFASLIEHAVPLRAQALAALSTSSMALDIYAWLAQRLWRVPFGRPTLVTWKALKDQFGWNYDRMRKFREVFRGTLKAVKEQYPKAQVRLDERGISLEYSPTPVPHRHSVKLGPDKDETDPGF
jgi:hypothetical protein